MKTISILLSTLLYLSSCNSSNNDLRYIAENKWEYQNGFRAGDTDFIQLGKPTEHWNLHHDTVYFKSKPIAIITRYEKKQELIEIRSTKTGKKGEYYKTPLNQIK